MYFFSCSFRDVELPVSFSMSTRFCESEEMEIETELCTLIHKTSHIPPIMDKSYWGKVIQLVELRLEGQKETCG